MSQNLCLICCYKFPAKRARFISDEAQESFRTFCSELGLPIDNDSHNSIKRKKDLSCELDLPYGENLTVCGDCLGIVVFYVQKRTVQRGKEEKVMELQKAVCAALKDLQEVVEEVQIKIDQLHSTIQMGDESCLDSYCRKTSNKENNPRRFREKILKLNTGFIKANKVSQKDGVQVPINIKVEPGDEEDNGPGPGPFRRTINDEADNNDPLGPDIVCDRFPDSDADSVGAGSNYSDEWTKRKNKSARKSLGANSKPRKKMKSEIINLEPRQFNFEAECRQAATQWKDALIGRILMQMNNDIHDGSPMDDETREDPRNSFQYLNGRLTLRDVDVIIREETQALKCTRCGKSYFEERDATGETQLETLMRDHILFNHGDAIPKRKYKRIEWEEVLPVSDADLERDWGKYRNRKFKAMHSLTYYCKYAKTRRACPVYLRKLIYQNGNVVFMQTANQHVNHRTCYLGLTPEQKRFVKELLFIQSISKPAEIMRRFIQAGKPEPDKNKLTAYLSTLRKAAAKTSNCDEKVLPGPLNG